MLLIYLIVNRIMSFSSIAIFYVEVNESKLMSLKFGLNVDLSYESTHQRIASQDHYSERTSL